MLGPWLPQGGRALAPVQLPALLLLVTELPRLLLPQAHPVQPQAVALVQGPVLAAARGGAVAPDG